MTDYKDPNFKDPDFKDPNCKISEQQTPAAKRPADENSASEDKDFLPTYLAKLGREEKIKAVKNAGIIYLPVKSMKFALLCICVPYHGYEIWWLYKNFVCQKERQGNMLSPLWRVNLPLLYLRKLFEAMREEGKLYGLADQLPVEKIVLYWVLLFCCSFFPFPYGLLGDFSFAPFIFVNEYLIKLNGVANPDLKLDTRYTFANYLVIIVGGAYFAFHLYLNIAFR
jgi:hypothetical protein